MLQPLEQVTLFEVSWETCNKVGGIYTVISTKALQAVETLKENYYILGPDLGNNPGFQETDEACWVSLRQSLNIRNLKCRLGRWDIPGNPKVILVNFSDRYNQNQLLYELWNKYGVDSMTGGWDYVEPVMFGVACGEIISIAIKTLIEPIGGIPLAHFHEWMCGSGLLTLKNLTPEAGTIFTTHATVLGRSISGSGADINKNMAQLNPQREAAAYNVTAKHSIESISAREADCFTTVSEITADEAEVILGRRPDYVTLNGLDLRTITDFSKETELATKTKHAIFDRTAQFLGYLLPSQTRIMLISGRYEFHNKGIDLFIEALSNAEQALQNSNTHILALCVAMAGHSGLTEYAKENHLKQNIIQPSLESRIATHHIHSPSQDPIINHCIHFGLTNQKEKHIHFIFIPAELNGQDDFFNMPYEKILSGCDLGVFPSWYEPWGYTPQESAAHAVPTVTTDLSGFGMWINSFQEKSHTKGISIIHRRHMPYEHSVSTLKDILLEYSTCSEETLKQHRINVRNVAQQCSWEKFFPIYIQTYQDALNKVKKRITNKENIKYYTTTGGSTTPNLHTITAITPLPQNLHRLRELYYNLWWSWQPESEKFFKIINNEVWEQANHNPISFLENISQEQLATNDPIIQNYYDTLIKKFDSYMEEQASTIESTISPENPVAYFSTEYGLHESIPLYSGGLGILSGDHLKSSSDLRIPMVAIGLLYKNGYFQQKIDHEGNQIATYPENIFSLLPIKKLKNQQNNPLYIELDLFPGRQLFAQIWKVQVGHVPLYLLDTDIAENTLDDRRITSQLYVADRDYRLRQEILLGMGGIRLLNLLKITPSVYHMNEGHSAFLILERLRNLMLWYNLPFEVAQECIRSNTMFTTHTPVEAGNERFEATLMEKYFMDYAKSINLSWHDFMNLGKLPSNNRNVFEMTVLALRHSSKTNGVSRLHSLVSKHMWAENWKGIPVPEVPIEYVTNGVHIQSYTGLPMQELLQKYIHPQWEELSPSSDSWENVYNIPDDELWNTRIQQKKPLIDKLNYQTRMNNKLSCSPPSTQKNNTLINPEKTLIIGFARRFAPYKRANLILADPERLYNILSNPKQPTILIFSGKSHPADQRGLEIIKQVIQYTKDPRFYGKIFFLENYNITIAKLLLHGCDLWLNTPRRPYEACGTSGQKISANGGLNLSIADGWWCEGYDGNNGWTIGQRDEQLLFEQDQCDYSDAESLYNLLEEIIIPLYFKNTTGIPNQWLSVVKNSIKTLTSQFNAQRMLKEYLIDYYIPLAKQQKNYTNNTFEIPKQLTTWKQGLAQRFGSINVQHINIKGLINETILYEKPLEITVTLNPGNMPIHEILIQFVIGKGKDNIFTEKPDIVSLTYTDEDYKKNATFTGTYRPKHNGTYVYGIRVLPTHDKILSLFDTELFLWL